jgi:hypothetical protein
MPPIFACIQNQIRVQLWWLLKLTGGPGSTGKNNPLSLIFSFSSIQETEGCTTMSILGISALLFQWNWTS